MRAWDIKGENAPKSQFKKPTKDCLIQKTFWGVFGNRFVPSRRRRIKNFKENLIGLSTGRSLIKNKNEPAIPFVKSRGLTCYNSPVGGLGELNKRDRKSDTAIGYINLK